MWRREEETGRGKGTRREQIFECVFSLQNHPIWSTLFLLCFKSVRFRKFSSVRNKQKAGSLNKSKLNQDIDIKNNFGFTFQKLVLYLTLHKVSCTMKREAEVPYTASLCQRITVVCWQSPLAGLFLLMFNCIFNYRLKPHLDKHQRLGSMSFHYTKKDLITLFHVSAVQLNKCMSNKIQS